MENRTMAGFRKKINEDTTFVHDREDRALDAIEKIFILCCSRDHSKLEKMDQTKVGRALLDIAEFYGENTPESRTKFRFLVYPGSGAIGPGFF